MRPALKCLGHLVGALLLSASCSVWAQVTISLTAPANGATYTAPAAVTVSANATPPSGYTISKVEFFQGTTLIGTDTNSPYSINWSNVGQGNYSLTAKATAIKKNSPNQTGISSARSITVNPPPPWVTLNVPANGPTYTPPASVTLTATATPPSGYTVSKVEFFHGSILIGTDTSAPYSIAWTNVPQGNYALTAKATAIKNNAPNQTATSSPPRDIIVSARPTVTLTSPLQGATFIEPITVRATASDNDGTVSRVDFYSYDGDFNRFFITSIAQAPYTFVWGPVPIFQVESGFLLPNPLEAIAFDNQGAASAITAVEVYAGLPLAITSPAQGATYTAPATLVLQATTGWPSAEVSFYSNGSPIPNPWQNVGPGLYSLTARVTIPGAYGDVSFTSHPVTVTVTSAAATLHFIHVDHLNTPRLISDSTGTAVWKWDQQEPFGISPPDKNPSGLGVFDFPLRFAGQYDDKETGLLYSYFRDCLDPATGRYCQSDPIGTVLYRDMAFRSLGSIASMHPRLASMLYSVEPRYNHVYGYALQNPLSFTDPLGLDPLSKENRNRERADRERPSDPNSPPSSSSSSGSQGMSPAQMAQCKACRDDEMKKCLIGGGVCAAGICGVATVTIVGGIACAVVASSAVGSSCWFLTDLYCASVCTVK
jgi:chitinase